MASRRIAGITIEIDGNTTKLNDALKSVDKQLASTQSQLRDVEKLLKLDPHNTELLAQKQRALTDAITASKDRLKELEKAQEELSKQDASPNLQKQQDALQREIEETKQKIKGFATELEKIPNKVQAVFEKAGQELKDIGSKITDVGEGMTKKVSAPIVGMGAAAVAAFSEVDNAMDTVVKKTGATGEELQSMQKIVENLATSIPTSFEEAGNAVGEINTRFGVTGEALEDLSGQFIKFAQLNNTTVSDSVDRTQRLMAAFGVETKDAGKLLDTLNRTTQKTGINVDKLTDLMANNAAALQSMGLSAEESAEFLGMIEVSGTDVTVAMRGLQQANKRAAKEGKTMNEVLEDFARYMGSTATEAEKTQKAIDIFGSRAGQSIYNAARQGKISFEDMASSMQSSVGSVEQTFEATIDGVDQWKTAMNEAKLLGSEIGGILSEFAGPILRKVRDALQEAVGWWRSLNENQQETVIKVAGLIAAIGPAVTVIGKMTSAVGLLSQGLGVLAAHPVAAAVIGITTAFGALAIELKKAGDAGDRYMSEMYGISEAMQANIDSIETLTQKYEESKQRREDTFSSFEAEYGYLQDLAEEYDSYLDDNGKIIEKYKDRAAFIENQLSNALGIEKSDIEEIIKKNGELSSSIDKVIEKRKAEAILAQMQNDYTEAILGTQDAEKKLLKAEDDLAQKSAQIKELQAERNTLEKQQQEFIAKNGYASSEYADRLQDLRFELEEAESAERTLTEARNEAAEVYEGYQATIKQYEGVSAAAIEGDTGRIHTALEQFKQDFRTAETSTEATLKKQVEAYKTQYEQAKNAVASGSKLITKTDLAEKEYWYKQAQLEYNKSTQAARDAAKAAAQGYADKIRAGRRGVADAAEYMGGGLKDPLKGLGSKAEDYGYDIAQGLANGIRRNASLATYAAQNMANAVDQKLHDALQIGSPSKLTEYFGRMLDEGLAIGMGAGEAIKAAQRLAEDVAQPFQSEENRNLVATVPNTTTNMVDAFSTALSRMKVEMDDREMGQFVEKTVVKAVYA